MATKAGSSVVSMPLSLSLLLLTRTAAPSSLYGDDRGVTAAARAQTAASRAAASTLQLDCPALITQTTDTGHPYATLQLEPAVATHRSHSWHVEPHAWSGEVTAGQFPLGKTDVGYLILSCASFLDAIVFTNGRAAPSLDVAAGPSEEDMETSAVGANDHDSMVQELGAL